jgi:hypothetical protein
METMVQCTFKKGNVIQTAYVEKKQGLKVGSIVELKSERAGNEQGWEVTFMGQPLDAQYVQDRSRDFAKTRQASDI